MMDGPLTMKSCYFIIHFMFVLTSLICVVCTSQSHYSNSMTHCCNGAYDSPMMRLALVCGLVVSMAMIGMVNAAPPRCRFAPSYTDDELINNPARQKQFVMDAMYWEVIISNPISVFGR
jgi:hypothetical protein